MSAVISADGRWRIFNRPRSIMDWMKPIEVRRCFTLLYEWVSELYTMIALWLSWYRIAGDKDSISSSCIRSWIQASICVQDLAASISASVDDVEPTFCLIDLANRYEYVDPKLNMNPDCPFPSWCVPYDASQCAYRFQSTQWIWISYEDVPKM